MTTKFGHTHIFLREGLDFLLLGELWKLSSATYLAHKLRPIFIHSVFHVIVSSNCFILIRIAVKLATLYELGMTL